MAPTVKRIRITGLILGSALGLLASNSTPDAPPAPKAAPAYISIRFNKNDKPTVYVSDATQKPVLVTTYTKDIKKFKVWTDAKAAQLSVQIAPWTGAYGAPWVWYLNDQWSISKEAVLSADFNASKGPGNDFGLKSYGEMNFTYDDATKTLSWVQDGVEGKIQPSSSSLGYYLVLKLADGADKGKVMDESGDVIAKTK